MKIRDFGDLYKSTKFLNPELRVVWHWLPLSRGLILLGRCIFLKVVRFSRPTDSTASKNSRFLLWKAIDCARVKFDFPERAVQESIARPGNQSECANSRVLSALKLSHIIKTTQYWPSEVCTEKISPEVFSVRSRPQVIYHVSFKLWNPEAGLDFHIFTVANVVRPGNWFARTDGRSVKNCIFNYAWSMNDR